MLWPFLPHIRDARTFPKYLLKYIYVGSLAICLPAVIKESQHTISLEALRCHHLIPPMCVCVSVHAIVPRH